MTTISNLVVSHSQPGAMRTTETEAAHLVRPQDAPTRACLTIAHHPNWNFVGLRAAIGEKGALLGRAATACLPGAFDVRKVSREHARVSVRDGKVYAEDLDSRNGTYVNGSRIEQQLLKAGDIVAVGGVLLMLTFGPPSYTEPRHEILRGHSWPIAKLLADVSRVAATSFAVTLLGETGTGKELAAGAIHAQSDRTGPLVSVNCGALAEGLLESELFGHVQGAFTGATAARQGLVAQAEGGTLLLDEITSTPPRLQAVMLRLLENGTYRPVGGNGERTADVRVIAAAQPDIAESIEAGRFRSDLWHRISRRVVTLPRLTERREDIPLLARVFAQSVRANAELEPTLSLALMRSHWPGNVRQLRNVVERIAEQSEGDTLSDTSMLEEVTGLPGADDSKANGAAGANKARLRRPKRARPTREELLALMEATEGRIADAARRLDVDRKTIYRWLAAVGIER